MTSLAHRRAGVVAERVAHPSGREIRRAADDHMRALQPVLAAVRAVVDRDVVDMRQAAEVDLPPRRRRVGVRAGAVAPGSLCTAAASLRLQEVAKGAAARTEFELSMARSGSPPQPTVDELAAPQRRTPLVPAQPPPHMLLVSTAQEPSATQGSNAQPPVGRPRSRFVRPFAPPPPPPPPVAGGPPFPKLPQASNCKRSEQT